HITPSSCTGRCIEIKIIEMFSTHVMNFAKTQQQSMLCVKINDFIYFFFSSVMRGNSQRHNVCRPILYNLNIKSLKFWRINIYVHIFYFYYILIPIFIFKWTILIRLKQLALLFKNYLLKKRKNADDI